MKTTSNYLIQFKNCLTLVVCPINFAGLQDPRLFSKVGDLSPRNPSEFMRQTTSPDTQPNSQSKI
ncbi:hypothetical protein B4U84_08070 [Westiellopsis prolifica IICB1]|nr:hypothetical protein B4U84_08070 [Westiellopsis prolifica IICB1]